MLAKGILIPIGGAEDKGTDLEAGIIERNRLNFFEIGILKTIVNHIVDNEKTIEVITTASSIPDEVAQNYKEAFEKLGFLHVNHLRIRDRDEVNNPEYLNRIKNADCIMFSGGNQLRLSSIFGGTTALEIMMNRLENESNFVIAGTSAGAMAMSRNMIYEGNAGKAHLKGEVRMTAGLGFVDPLIIDSHFDKRGRFARLAQAVAANPGAIGVGLGEDTGIVIHGNEHFEVIGNGAVTIVDGRNISFNNIGDVEFGQPIAVENLTVSILSLGQSYNFKTRTLLAEESA